MKWQRLSLRKEEYRSAAHKQPRSTQTHTQTHSNTVNMCVQRRIFCVPCGRQDEVFLSLCRQSEKNKRFNDLGPTVARTGFWKKDIEVTGHHKTYEYFIHRLTSFIYTCFFPIAPADLFGLCRQIPIEIVNPRGWQSNNNGRVMARKKVGGFSLW